MPISFLRLDFTKSLLLFSSLIFFVGISIFGLRQLYSQAKLSSANLDEASLAAKLEEDESATVSGELASSRSAGRFEGTSASGSGKEVNKKAESEKKLFSLSLCLSLIKPKSKPNQLPLQFLLLLYSLLQPVSVVVVLVVVAPLLLVLYPIKVLYQADKPLPLLVLI